MIDGFTFHDFVLLPNVVNQRRRFLPSVEFTLLELISTYGSNFVIIMICRWMALLVHYCAMTSLASEETAFSLRCSQIISLLS